MSEPIRCPRCGEEIRITDTTRSYGYMVVGLNILAHSDSCTGGTK